MRACRDIDIQVTYTTAYEPIIRTHIVSTDHQRGERKIDITDISTEELIDQTTRQQGKQEREPKGPIKRHEADPKVRQV